jgi:hypothetical protein
LAALSRPRLTALSGLLSGIPTALSRFLLSGIPLATLSRLTARLSGILLTALTRTLPGLVLLSAALLLLLGFLSVLLVHHFLHSHHCRRHAVEVESFERTCRDDLGCAARIAKRRKYQVDWYF